MSLLSLLAAVAVQSAVTNGVEVRWFEDMMPAKDGVKLPHVAVMGCVVNGPGEAKGADIALCGADGEFVLYVRGKQVCRVSEEDAVGKVVEYAVSLQ